jgi:hypothetical protein
MSFAAPIFLWYFMPLVLLLYWVLPHRFRNGLVALASLTFYVYGAGPYIFLLLACMVANYSAGLAVDSNALAPRDQLRKAVQPSDSQPQPRSRARPAQPHRVAGIADRNLVLHLPPHVLRDRCLPAQP